MQETIAIRNPRVIEVAHEEMTHGAGRSTTEAAENLILEAAEKRKLGRAEPRHPANRRERRRPAKQQA